MRRTKRPVCLHAYQAVHRDPESLVPAQAGEQAQGRFGRQVHGTYGSLSVPLRVCLLQVSPVGLQKRPPRGDSGRLGLSVQGLVHVPEHHGVVHGPAANHDSLQVRGHGLEGPMLCASLGPAPSRRHQLLRLSWKPLARETQQRACLPDVRHATIQAETQVRKRPTEVEDARVVQGWDAAILSWRKPGQPGLPRMHDEVLATALRYCPHKLPRELRGIAVVHPKPALHRDGDLYCAAHGVHDVPHHFPVQHQRAAELPLLGHAAGWAAHVEVHLVVAVALHHLRSLRELPRVAAAELAHQGMLRGVVAQEPVAPLGLEVVQQRVVHDHLGPELGAAREQPHEEAEVAVRDLHHGCDLQEVTARSGQHACTILRRIHARGAHGARATSLWRTVLRRRGWPTAGSATPRWRWQLLLAKAF
mmetsp:Transcript_48134/g.153599  ORF Transcript_48134/g.153599 Transcript_48134/m.153599 type:complete len:418 (+) Transcript_48134:299-1552(+)